MMNPFKTKKGLGRGLSSLIGDADQKPIKNKVSISSITRNKFQPRKNFDVAELDELAESIKANGILQPILVRPLTKGGSTFEIIAGERRWRASQIAKIHEVPVIGRVLSVHQFSKHLNESVSVSKLAGKWKKVL